MRLNEAMSPTKMTLYDSAMQAPDHQADAHHTTGHKMSMLCPGSSMFILYLVGFALLAAYLYMNWGKWSARDSNKAGSWGEYSEDEEDAAPLTGNNTTAHYEDGSDTDDAWTTRHRPAAKSGSGDVKDEKNVLVEKI